ncbi:MAG: rRNA maturation RNase YbeY [Minisyncoccia bacterium]|jgi:probable rRNA maturation factor
MANSISVFISRGKYKRDASGIKSIGRKLPGLLKKNNIGLEVHLISDSEMKALNRKFRGKNQVANILSFEAETGSVRPDLKRNTRYLGEIFLAPDCANARGDDPKFLFVHGFLHLLRYTHKRKRDRMKMERLEERLCKELKIRPTYV